MRFITYLRVSTQKQGQSGLGLDAQRAMIAAYSASAGGEIVQEYIEVESGKVDDRAQLTLALAHARRMNATILIAKLDRLARRVSFIANLMESKTPFVVCDLPQADAFTLHIYAALGEKEAKMISDRTKAALCAAKARGVRLGGARDGAVHVDPKLGLQARQQAAQSYAASVVPRLREMQANGCSLRQMAAEMTARGIATPRCGTWTANTVRLLLK